MVGVDESSTELSTENVDKERFGIHSKHLAALA